MNQYFRYFFNISKKCMCNILLSPTRYYSSQSNPMKVTIIGAAGKIGQPLCLMLKQSSLIEELCIHDVVPISALAAELNHIDTSCRVTAWSGEENLSHAMKRSKIVVVLAAAPEADFMPFDKMWTPNAQIVKKIVTTFSATCPKAFLAIGTNPVNSLIPMAYEILKKGGHCNPNGIFGITTLHSVRANTFVSQVQGIDPECIVVPVIGGNSEETIVPLLSHAKPCSDFTDEELATLTAHIRKAQDNMRKLKQPDSAPLSSAFASARFVISLVKAFRGQSEILECAYVPSKAHPQLKYFATPLILGPNGVAKNLGIPKLTDYESCLLDNALPFLISDIKRGEEFAGTVENTQTKEHRQQEVNTRIPRCPEDWKQVC